MKSSGIDLGRAEPRQVHRQPEQVVHGNKMKPFGGIADAGERKKIIDYLKTLK